MAVKSRSRSSINGAHLTKDLANVLLPVRALSRRFCQARVCAACRMPFPA